MSLNLLGLCGYAQSGKDTVAAALAAPPLSFQRVAFADAVREFALAVDPLIPWLGQSRDVGDDKDAVFNGECWRLSEMVRHKDGWEHAKKSPEVRKLLQRVGTEGGRRIIGDSVWIDIALRKVREIQRQDGGRAVITDCRFRNEAQVIKSNGGIILLITRPGVGPVNQHVSDAGIGEIQAAGLVDGVVVNDGTVEELGEKVKGLLREKFL